jgi:hypothetical protein
METSKLLEYDSRLVAFTQELSFPKGKPLSPIAEEEEGRTVLVDYSSSGEFSPQRHVYMASLHEHGDDNEPVREYNDELLADVSTDEHTADAPQDEDEQHRRIQRIKNAKRAKCRRNTEARVRNPPPRRNLNGAFATADDHRYNTPIRNITEAALLIQQLTQNPEIERFLHLTQRAIVQLDQRDPISSLQHSRSRSENHASSIPQASRTPGGRPNPR